MKDAKKPKKDKEKLPTKAKQKKPLPPRKQLPKLIESRKRALKLHPEIAENKKKPF